MYRDRLDRLYLFGSRARGDAEDVDVLVVLKGDVNPNEERQRTLDIVSDLSLENDVVISCLFMDSETYVNKQGHLLRNIRREGVSL